MMDKARLWEREKFSASVWVSTSKDFVGVHLPLTIKVGKGLCNAFFFVSLHRRILYFSS